MLKSNLCVQAAYNVEYVIEAQCADDRRDWVATLKYCMRESRAIVDGAERSVSNFDSYSYSYELMEY